MDHDLNYILIHILARPGTQSESTASTYRNALRSVGITDLDGLTNLRPREIDTLRLRPAEKNRIGALVAWFKEHPNSKYWKKLTTSDFDSWCLRHARRAQRRQSNDLTSKPRDSSRERALLKSDQSSSSSSVAPDDNTAPRKSLYRSKCSSREQHFLKRLIPAIVLLVAVLGIGFLFVRMFETPYNYISVGVWFGVVVIICCWPGQATGDRKDSYDNDDDTATKRDYEAFSQTSSEP